MSRRVLHDKNVFNTHNSNMITNTSINIFSRNAIKRRATGTQCRISKCQYKDTEVVFKFEKNNSSIFDSSILGYNISVSKDGETQYIFLEKSTNPSSFYLYRSIDSGITWNEDISYNSVTKYNMNSFNNHFVYVININNIGSLYNNDMFIFNSNEYKNYGNIYNCCAVNDYNVLIGTNTSILQHNIISADTIIINEISGIWTTICSSSNGEYIYACENSSSSNGLGLLHKYNISTWTSINLPPSNWKKIICSTDGKYVYVYSINNTTNNVLFYSNDYGSSWNKYEFTNVICDINCTYDSSKIFVVTKNSDIWKSEDFGITWELYINTLTDYKNNTFIGISSDANTLTILQNKNGNSINFYNGYYDTV